MFVPGARVAVRNGYHGDTWTEDFVLKVFKNGRFTLRGDPSQQWHPDRDQTTAWETGDHNRWHRRHLELWTLEAEAKVAETRRGARLRKLHDRLGRVRAAEITEVALDQIEAALASVAKKDAP